MKTKHIEVLKYGCNGVLTTLVNYLIYIALYQLQVHYMIANTLAWVGAVVFAYYTNRKWVFQSQESIKKEFLGFVSMRFITLLVENILLYFSVQVLGVYHLLAKVIISFITIIANYAICKCKIFTKGAVCHEQN